MRHWRLIIWGGFVLLAGTITGSFFGSIAAFYYGMYRQPHSTVILDPVFAAGGSSGAATGLIAGAIWCRVMIPRIMRTPQRGWARAGAWVGMTVGWLSTTLLHATLTIVSTRVDGFTFLLGLGCGTISGLVLGALCGRWCGAAARHSFCSPDLRAEAAPP